MILYVKCVVSCSVPFQLLHLPSTDADILVGGCYNRQGRKAKERRSRDNHINRGYTGTQTVRNTGTYNQTLHLPLHLTRATSVTNENSTLVFMGDLSPWRHLTARSPCQEVSPTTIHRPLTLDQRHAEFPMWTSQKRAFSHCWPLGGSNLAQSDNGLGASLDNHMFPQRQE